MTAELIGLLGILVLLFLLTVGVPIGVSLAVFLAMDIFGLPGRSGPLILPGDLYAAREIVHLRLAEIGGGIFS